jgi:hypothetical protein
MSYIGNRPDTNILYYALGIDRFSGTGSQTVFSLSRELGQDLDAQVIVENVIQEPGASYAYSISGSTLTFTEAPPTGTIFKLFLELRMLFLLIQILERNKLVMVQLQKVKLVQLL